MSPALWKSVTLKLSARAAEIRRCRRRDGQFALRGRPDSRSRTRKTPISAEVQTGAGINRLTISRQRHA
jgi:hypothetical protein